MGEWFGDSGDMAKLEDEIVRRGGWGAANNPRVREFLAREHVDGRQAVAELARGHDLPASRIRTWVKVYRDAGRAGLEALEDETC